MKELDQLNRKRYYVTKTASDDAIEGMAVYKYVIEAYGIFSDEARAAAGYLFDKVTELMNIYKEDENKSWQEKM